MEENEKFDSDFSNDKIPISEEFWNYMENYWHNNREFPESTEASFSKKADLVDGKVPSSQLPSYVDDVLEFDTFQNLPNTGEKGKIYLITNDNSQFRWSGSEYIQLNSDEFLMTTNTQQGVYGTKEFYTSGGSNNYTSTTLRIAGFTGNNAIIGFNSFGAGVGTVQFDGGDYFFTNDDISGRAKLIGGGFIKDGYSDNSVLLAGGGHKLISDFVLQPDLNNYQTLNTVQNVSASKNYYSSTPFTFKNSSTKSWVFHKPLSEDLIFAPSLSIDSDDWDWANQIRFNEQGLIYSKGYVKNGSDNTKILLAGGGDKSLDDLMTTNTIQYLNPTGTKNFYTEGGTQYYHNSLWIRGNNEGAAISFVDNGVAQIRFTQDNFYFTSSGGTNMIPIHAGGFIKEGYNNEFILLAGGDAKLISDFVASKIINGSYNANNLSTNSITYGYSVANAPTSASSHSFTTLNLDTADPNFKMQIGFDGDTNEMFSRTKSAGNWNDWVKYATTSQLSNYLPLTGGTLTDHLTIERPNGSSLGVTSHHLALTAANFDYTGFAMFIPSSNVIEILIGNSIAWGTIKLQPYGGQLFYGNNEVATVNQFQNYYTKNESLNLFVGLNGVQTIYDTKTFNSSPVIPNGTLGNHAVNLNQLNNKVTNEDSVRGVAFDSGLSTGVPYFIHTNGTYVPIATQSWVSSNYIPKTHPSYELTSEMIADLSRYKGYIDDRYIYPDELQTQKLRFGFTSWNNNGDYPYADFLHFGGYQDLSGGNQNLVAFKKNGFGLRQWQGTSQSPVAYQSYVDYWHTGNFNPNDYQPLGSYVTTNTEQAITARKVINKDLGTNNYLGVAQHFAQFQIGRNADQKSMEFAVLDNGVSVIQSKEVGVGYNPLILNPANSGGVGIGTTSNIPGYGLTVGGSTYISGNTKTTEITQSGQGFQNIEYFAGRNRIWSFANADQYGISYQQGGFVIGNINYGEGINFHFGNSSDFKVHINIDGTIYSKINGNSEQWATAYGWGNHANVGYATQNYVALNYISNTHIANTITVTNIQQWNDAYSYGIRVNNVFSVNSGQSLIIIDDYNGGDAGLYDESYNKIVAGKDNPEFLKYGSTYGEWNGINFNMASDLVSIGKPNSNAVDKVQIAGDISVDALYYDNNDANLILNPLYDESGDVRDSRNAHIYIVTGNNVRLPIKPILGQRIEVFNNSDSTIGIEHDNVGTLFYLSAFKGITGIVYRRGFVFDEEAVVAKNYEI